MPCFWMLLGRCWWQFPGCQPLKSELHYTVALLVQASVLEHHLQTA
jgi:hypothetical protein